MDSSSPDSRSPSSPLDSLDGDVRQRLLFDWQESRFGETAEPDPLSFGSPQQAQRVQQADRGTEAMRNTFQVWRASVLHASSVHPSFMPVAACANQLVQTQCVDPCLTPQLTVLGSSKPS